MLWNTLTKQFKTEGVVLARVSGVQPIVMGHSLKVTEAGSSWSNTCSGPDSTVRLSQSGSREQWTDAFYTKRCPWVSGSWAARYGLNVKCPQRAHVAEHWLPSWWFYLRRWRDLWRQSLAGGRRSVGVGLEIHGQPHFLFILHFLSVNARWQPASCSYSHAFPADCLHDNGLHPLELWTKISPFSFKLLWSEYFIIMWK